MALVFVYGTLKHGNRLNPVLAGDKFLCHTATTDESYDLVGGSSFPFMARAEQRGYRIRGDLYEVSDATLTRLDHIEGYNGPNRNNFYERETILVKNGNVDEEAFVYLCGDGNMDNYTGIVVHPQDNSKEWVQP